MSDLPDLVATVLDHAVGEEEIEAYGVHQLSTTIQAGTDATMRHVGRAETRGLGIRLIRDGRLGYASTSELDSTAISLTVQRARANADASDIDEAQQLPPPQLTDAVDGLLHPSLPQTTLADKISLVEDVTRRVVSLDPRVTALDTAEYHDEQSTVAIASTRGVRVVHEAGYVELWTDALGEDGGVRASDYAYQVGRTLAVLDPEWVAEKAVKRTVRLMGPVGRVRPGIPVVFDPDVVADVVTAIGKGLSGGPVSSGRTPFAGKEGALVAAVCVNLSDDGLSLRFPATHMYDDEGVPQRRTPLIQRGTLVGALHSTVTANAACSSVGSTGNAHRASHKSVPRAAPTSLVLEATMRLDELLSRLDEAVYIQQLSGSGSGINPVTGRIDVGGVGGLLRRGQIVDRVDTVPIATSLLSFLQSIVAVADDGCPVPLSSAAGSTVLCDGSLIGSSR